MYRQLFTDVHNFTNGCRSYTLESSAQKKKKKKKKEEKRKKTCNQHTNMCTCSEPGQLPHKLISM